MARGRSRKRGGGGGRGRRQKNDGMPVVFTDEGDVDGAVASDNVNVAPQTVPFDLSLVKQEPADDDDLGLLGLQDIKQERGSGAGLVDKLETQLDTESTKPPHRRRSNTPSAPPPEPTRKSSRISERLSNRSSEPTPRAPSPPKRQRRSKSKPVTPAPPQLTMMDVKREPDSDDEERYDIARVKLEVLTPPHEAEDLGHGSVGAVVAMPSVEQVVPKVKKPLIKPPVLKLDRNVGVGVTVTVEKEGREEVGVVVEGVEEPADPEMVKITSYTPLSSVLREKYYVVDPDKDKAVFEKPLGYMVKSAVMGYHDLATNKLPKLTRKMNLQAAHSHALASSLSEKHQLQIELMKQNEKYRTTNSSLDMLTGKERHRAENAWQELERTKLHSKTQDEGQTQQHFLGKKFSDAVENIRLGCEKRLKDLELDRGKLAKENEVLVRGKEAYQKKLRKVNGRVSELEGVVEELKSVVGGLISVIGEECGKGGKHVEAVAVKVFGEIVKGCFNGKGDGGKELRDAVFGRKKRADCHFDSAKMYVGHTVEVADQDSDQEEFIEVGDEGKGFEGEGMFSELDGDDVSLVVENFGGVMSGLDGLLDAYGGKVVEGGSLVDKAQEMDVDQGLGADQIVILADEQELDDVGHDAVLDTTVDAGNPEFDGNTKFWLQFGSLVVGGEAQGEGVANELQVTYNLVKTGERVGEQVGHEVSVQDEVGAKEMGVTGELVGEQPQDTDQHVKELPITDAQVDHELPVEDEVVAKEMEVTGEQPQDTDHHVKESPITDEDVKMPPITHEHPVQDEVVAKELEFTGEQVDKQPQDIDQEVKEPPNTDKQVGHELPVEDEVVAKEMEVAGEQPQDTYQHVAEPPITEEQVGHELPVQDEVVAKELEATSELVDEQPQDKDQEVKESPITEDHVAEPPITDKHVEEPPITDEHVEVSPITDKHVEEPPITDEQVKEPPITDEHVKEPPITEDHVKEIPTTDKQVGLELPVLDEVVGKELEVTGELVGELPQDTDQLVKEPSITDDQLTNEHVAKEPVVTEVHPGVVLTTLPNSEILVNGRRGYEPGETISDWPDDPTDDMTTTPTELFESRGTKRKQNRRERGRERKMRRVQDDEDQQQIKTEKPEEPSHDAVVEKPDETVRDRLSKQVGAIVAVGEVGGKCEKRKLEDHVKKVKGEKKHGGKKVKKGLDVTSYDMVDLFGEEDVDERGRERVDYDFESASGSASGSGSGSSGASLYGNLLKDLDLSETDSESEDEEGSEVLQKEMEDRQSQFESLVLSPLTEITTENTTVIYPLINLLKKFDHPAQPFYTMMIDSTEDDLNQDLQEGEKTINVPLIPRFRHILACIVQISRLGREFNDFWKVVLEYLSNVIKDDSKRDIEDEFLIKSIGRLVGGICYEFKGDREGVGIVMDVCLHKGPYCYAFAYGAFCSYSDMLGWSKDVMGFGDLRVESKGLVWYLCRNVKWGDVSISKSVMDMLRVALGVPVPEENLVSFLGGVVNEIRGGGGLGGGYAKVISLACVGLGVGWFERSFCVMFDGWLKEFGEGGISGGGFKVLVEGMGMAAVTFRRDDLPVDLNCVTARLDIICRMKNMPDDIIVIANDYQGQIAQLKLRDPGEPIDGWGEYGKKSAVKPTKCFSKKKKNKKRCDGRRGGGSQGPLVPVPLSGSVSIGRPALLPTPERSPGGGWVRGGGEWRGRGQWKARGERGGGRGEGRGGFKGRGDGRGSGEGRGGGARGGVGGRGRGEGARARGRGGRGGARGQRGQRGY